MDNTVYRLLRPGVFESQVEHIALEAGQALVRPTFLSICAADQRYWSGRRDPQALAEKLPMALIHEAVGTVVEDTTGAHEPGASVVMVPNTPDPDDPDTASKENYARASKFRSSGIDGFMSDYVVIASERLVAAEGIDPLVASMGELVSVCCNAVEAFDEVRRVPRNHTVGIWGDGAVGYLCAAILRELHPELELIVFGTHDSKLAKFDFVDAKHNIRKEFKEGFPAVDHAFECVGGTGGSTSAIEQIVSCIRPQGVISLMGVSEQRVPINTRMVLEKGLTLQGNSRSSKQDFELAVRLFSRPDFARRVRNIVQHVCKVECIEDMQAAFKFDELNPFKTIMEWRVCG